MKITSKLIIALTLITLASVAQSLNLKKNESTNSLEERRTTETETEEKRPAVLVAAYITELDSLSKSLKDAGVDVKATEPARKLLAAKVNFIHLPANATVKSEIEGDVAIVDANDLTKLNKSQKLINATNDCVKTLISNLKTAEEAYKKSLVVVVGGAVVSADDKAKAKTAVKTQVKTITDHLDTLAIVNRVPANKTLYDSLKTVA
jgi:hypothetical protein